MGERRSTQILEDAATGKSRRGGGKVRAYGVIALVTIIIIAAVVAAIAIPIHLLNKAQSKNEALEAALDETERKLELREQAAAALQAQQNAQKTEIEKLQEEIQNLLHVEEPDPVITSDQLAQQLSSLKELVTKKYVYTNAAIREANKTWLWGWDMPFSDTSLLVTYDGVIKAGIDLGKVEIDVDQDTRTITVTLPPSQVTDNSIPQETINVLTVRNSLFNSVTFDDYNKFIGEEKKAMEEKAISMSLLEDADAEAENIIRAFLNLLPGIDTYTLVFS